MPANVGEMFYTGAVPWHKLGIGLTAPATVDQALKVGGLDWRVDDIGLMTADDPPSPVERRKALVRSDRPPGHEGRVVGVNHLGFKPVQNREGAMLFDAIFGQGRAVYHTGGYLGHGEVIWLLAKIDRTITIGADDFVEPYALLANSHDGSMAFNIRLTTIRVVCQNTLSLAMREKGLGESFRRSHQGSLRDHANAAQTFFAKTLEELDYVAESFTGMANKTCDDAKFKTFLDTLMPEPKPPRNPEQNPGLTKAWERKCDDIRKGRKEICRLRLGGKGADLQTARGTFWGALNAVTEYIDHYKESKTGQLSYALLGDGMEFKAKAFRIIQEMSTAV